MTLVYEKLDTENPVFMAYCTYAGILVIKLVSMSFLTGMNRFRKGVVANPEDAGSNAQVKFDDPDVERVRRAHLNDLENLTPFFIIGFLYVLTDPNVMLATMLYRIIAAARIIHTLVYAVYPIRQPARGIAFITALLPTVFMAVMVIITFIYP